MQDAKVNLGSVVRAARQKCELTQDKLAENLGVQPRTILEIENGRGNPQFDILYPLINQLNIVPQSVFHIGRDTSSSDIEEFVCELSAFSVEERRIAIAAAHAVLKEIRFFRQSETGNP